MTSAFCINAAENNSIIYDIISKQTNKHPVTPHLGLQLLRVRLHVQSERLLDPGLPHADAFLCEYPDALDHLCPLADLSHTHTHVHS